MPHACASLKLTSPGQKSCTVVGSADTSFELDRLLTRCCHPDFHRMNAAPKNLLMLLKIEFVRDEHVVVLCNFSRHRPNAAIFVPVSKSTKTIGLVLRSQKTGRSNKRNS